MNLKKSITILISILSLFPHFYCQFPEDFSSIDQLTYTPTTSEQEEVYINSYYKDSSSQTIQNQNGYILVFNENMDMVKILTEYIVLIAKNKIITKPKRIPK